MSETDRLIAIIQKSQREELRVTVSTYLGQDILHLRVWYQCSDGVVLPGKQGVALRLDLADKLIAALRGAQEDGYEQED